MAYSTAKWVAPLSFVIDFAAQQYGLFSSPNMQDIHDANLSFFSPQPYFIGAFFFPQQLLQLAWLYRLWKLDPKKSELQRKELDQIVDYVPFYAVGNLCIASKPRNSSGAVQRCMYSQLHSMDDILELQSPRHLQYLRHHQHCRSTLLFGRETPTHGQKLHLLYPDTPCLQDLCRYRCTRSPA